VAENEAELVNSAKENANQEIGGPGGGVPDDHWRSRGYLPHFEGPLAVRHVTFHLADSLPKAALERMEAEIKCLPIKRQAVQRRKRLEAWIDAGHGGCVLGEPVIAEMVRNSLLYFDGQRYFLLAWVVMPNHVHVLFQPKGGGGLLARSWARGRNSPHERFASICGRACPVRERVGVPIELAPEEVGRMPIGRLAVPAAQSGIASTGIVTSGMNSISGRRWNTFIKIR
jgi:hypothetical protein